MQRPDFRAPRFGKRGYHSGEVDEFVSRVLARVDGRPEGDAVTAADLRIMVFHEPPRGSKGYSADEVDEWLERVRPAVLEVERRRPDPNAAPPPNTVIAMPGPPHFADRFPRVSRAILGYAVEDVDAFLDEVTGRLQRGEFIAQTELKQLLVREQKGGYRQAAVHASLDLIALALRHQPPRG